MLHPDLFAHGFAFEFETWGGVKTREIRCADHITREGEYLALLR
jgi:hypothetical protein